MDYAETAVDIARRAGATLREHLGKVRHLECKGELNNLVTEMDRQVEAFVAGELHRSFPTHAVKCEEGTESGAADAEFRWHVDPLDGTHNYVHRFPWFAVSLGLEQREHGRSHLVAGAVYHVMMDEMFWATEGQGAYLNGERIHVSRADRLEDTLLATGFPYWVQHTTETILRNMDPFLRRAHGIRRAGSAALDLAYVACGRLDGYWEEGLNSWDVAAGALLVREAGGIVTDYDGHRSVIPTAHIIASNGRIHDAMVGVLAGHYRDAAPASPSRP